MEKQPLAKRMQEEMIQEIEAARPAYAVWVRDPTSWLESRDSERLLVEWCVATTSWLLLDLTLQLAQVLAGDVHPVLLGLER